MKHKKPAIKKHYPDKNLVRHQGSCIEKAMMALARFGIEVMGIDFTGSIPVIEILYSSGVDQVRGIENKGRGYKNKGFYIRKMAHVQGCQIEWDEVNGS